MITLLAPLALFASALLAIPIILHLFKPRKVRRTPFSSLRWLHLSQQKLARRIKWHQVILFLLRFAVDESGPFGTSVAGHVALADGGVQVAVSVTNAGDREGIASCRITRDGTPRPDDLAFRTERLAPGATVTVTRTVPAPAGSAALVPERMTVICA